MNEGTAPTVSLLETVFPVGRLRAPSPLISSDTPSILPSVLPSQSLLSTLKKFYRITHVLSVLHLYTSSPSSWLIHVHLAGVPPSHRFRAHSAVNFCNMDMVLQEDDFRPREHDFVPVQFEEPECTVLLTEVRGGRGVGSGGRACSSRLLPVLFSSFPPF